MRCREAQDMNKQNTLISSKSMHFEICVLEWVAKLVMQSVYISKDILLAKRWRSIRRSVPKLELLGAKR
jgi:hypothetical protein